MLFTQTFEEKKELITRGLQEIINGDHLFKLLENGKVPQGYWGTAPTGSIHIGYLIPALKEILLIRDVILKY